MLFNSYEFLFFFLPIVLGGFAWLGSRAPRRVVWAWLLACSLFYHAWWNPIYLWLLVGSLTWNFLMGRVILRTRLKPSGRWFLTLGIVTNLGALGYYKYANFFADTLSSATGLPLQLAPILLPIGISFFTFQQLSYLIDVYREPDHDYHFIDYCLFVVFFPHLVAGPLVHHREMLPQFEREGNQTVRASNLAIGLSMFAIGLFKKVAIADSFAPYANTIFEAFTKGSPVPIYEAWIGLSCYALQLYFDFSGYSDMAVGLARMFGVRLPANFDSPYKATSVIDFWRRWHISLSRFLREYLYIPLGGNRKGPIRRYVNLWITMLLGGLWHGAGWNYIIWGGLHGLYLSINHAWSARFKSKPGRVGKWMGGGLTLIAVLTAWVFFRADSLNTALSMVQTLYGLNAEAWTAARLQSQREFFTSTAMVILGWLLVWLAPNSQEWMGRMRPIVGWGWKPKADDRASRLVRACQWRPNWGWLVIVVLALAWSISQIGNPTEFLYYQF